MKEVEMLNCPFCDEPDFDLIGLKFHLGSCDEFDAVQAVSNPMVESGTSSPITTADQANAAAEAIAKRYTVGKGSVAVIAAIITRYLVGTPDPCAAAGRHVCGPMDRQIDKGEK